MDVLRFNSVWQYRFTEFDNYTNTNTHATTDHYFIGVKEVKYMARMLAINVCT